MVAVQGMCIDGIWVLHCRTKMTENVREIVRDCAKVMTERERAEGGG